jgi:hypothetical protein
VLMPLRPLKMHKLGYACTDIPVIKYMHFTFVNHNIGLCVVFGSC